MTDAVAETAVRAGPSRTRRVPVRATAAVLAAAGVAVLTGGGVLLNAPVDAPAWLGQNHRLLAGAALLAVAAAAVLLGALSTDPVVRVGLVAAGIFPALTVFSTAAYAPAMGVVLAGGALAVAASHGRPEGYLDARAVAVAGVLVAAVAAALAGATGLAPPWTRTAGTVLWLLGAASLPVATETDGLDWGAGALAGVATAQFALAAPFVAGAVFLVGGGIVGAPLSLVALGAFGGAAATVGGLRHGRPTAGAGALLVVLAGVPATLPRALAVVVGLVLLASPGGAES